MVMATSSKRSSESDDLEVGDGYVGAIISVYSGDEKIGEVEPGLIRFDGSPNPPRRKSIHWFAIMETLSSSSMVHKRLV